MIEQTYRIDMIPDGAPVVVHVSQYDTAARRLSFELYNGGVAYELPAGAVASIAGTKPDNTSFLYAMTVSGNLVSIDLQQQMALVAGDVPAEIQITGAEGKIGSANFIIRVERGPIDENSVISETDLPIFEQLVSDAQTAANEAQTAAEDAAEAASSVGSIVPASAGTAGQVLTKTATGADWQDVDGLPAGGTAGQVLTKNSSTDGDASWQTPQSTGGSWGSIAGTLSDQTDLQNALNAKANTSTLATVESTSTASQAYSVGDYLVLNGQLYEVTTAITSGETLTVGTNISATTVGDYIAKAGASVGGIRTQVEANTNAIESERTARQNGDSALHSEIESVRSAVGSPLTASTAAKMTNTNKVYVYTGSETGYTAGDWYYYNGSAWVDGGVYNSVAFNTDKTLSVEGSAADAKKTGDAVSDLNQALTAVPNGGTQLTSDLFIQIGEKDIRLKNLIYVSAGNKIITTQSNLYQRWQIKDGAGNILEEKRGPYDKIEILDEEYTFQHSGYFSITIANGHNWGNSSAIVPADMTANIRVINNMAEVIAENLRDVELPNLKYLYTEILSEEESASGEDKFAYYPCKFVSGQKYIVKIKFSEFVSTTDRKYSIRTTTDRYTSSTYVVDVVVIVDVNNPVIDQEYTYEFIATQKDGANAKYLALELNTSGNASCKIEVLSITTEDNTAAIKSLEWINAKDILSLNHDALDLVLDGKKPFNRATTVPLALLHFSDIHGNQVNLERLVQMANHLGTDIDDTICTGDMVANNYSAEGMNFWNSVDGAENILMVVGNHDLADGQHGYSSDQIGQTVAYQTYFSPHVSNWGVTMAGENLTYWYKDYANKKVRLIGLNYLLEDEASTAQRAWLIDRLVEAKTAGYAVVIAEHSPLNSFTEIPCNFNIIGKPWTYNEIKAQFQDAVQDFIDGGGEFACYISGHSHNDYVGYNSNYPQQICIAITTALTTGLDNDQRRAVNDKTQDAANVVIVDTVTKTVKLVRIGANTDTYLRGRNLFSIRYTDKTIIAQS